MIVGFDSDDESVFAQQSRSVHEARIVQAMINTLVAIPRTPLFSRLEREGRLDNSGEMGDFGTISTKPDESNATFLTRRVICAPVQGESG